MLNIGIYLSSEPYSGGAYQYNLLIISALNSFDKSKFRITVFCHNNAWLGQIPKDFDTVVVSRPILLRVIGKVYKTVDRNKDRQRKFAQFFNPVIRHINKSDCDLIIYPSQDDVSYQTNKKSLSTIHDLMHRYESHFEEYQNGEYERREKHYSMMCQYVDGILVDSNIGKQQVIESYGIEKHRVFVLPFVSPTYLLDSINIDIKSKYNLPDKYLFYPAQFWEHKNHINLLSAIKILKDKNIITNLVLVGSKKNNYEKVIKAIDDFGLQGQVYVLGYVSNDEMASLYKNAMATTFVSLIGPTNIPPIEALTLGSPLICSNAYGMPEQVGDAALLVDPKNPTDIAKKIEVLMSDSLLRNVLVDKGHQKIAQNGQSKFNAELQVIIQKLVSF